MPSSARSYSFRVNTRTRALHFSCRVSDGRRGVGWLALQCHGLEKLPRRPDSDEAQYRRLLYPSGGVAVAVPNQTNRPPLPIRRASLRASGGPGGLGDPVGVWPCAGSWFRPVMVHRREGNVQILAARPHDSDDIMDPPFQRAWFAGFGHGRSSQHAARPNPGAFGRGLLPPGHVRLYLRRLCFSRPHGGFRRHVFAYGAGVQSALRRPPLRSKLRAH